jgi:hypothetical protein
MAKKQKLPADVNKKAKSIVDIATGESEAKDVDPIKAAAAALGRKGGLKGGKARAEALTPEQRAEIAKKAAAARWGNKED